MFIKFKHSIVLLLMLVLFLPAIARADSNNEYSTITGTLGGNNPGSGDYTIWVSSDGVVHYAKDTGILYPYLPTTSTQQTLTAAQTGTTLVINNGAGTYTTGASGATFTLPSAIPKLQYSFIIDVAGVFRLKPASGEIINFSTDVANSKIKNTSKAIGDSITIWCSTAGQWSIKDKVGTWATDNNP